MAEQTIDFEGVKYNFPDEATDEQVLEFLSNVPKEETKERAEPFREQAIIKKDEGVVKIEDSHVSYDDIHDNLTGGRGHLLTKEEKKLYPRGSVIPDDVVKEWFRVDMNEADTELTELLEENKVHVPDEAYDILMNMTFNMGKKSMKGFKKMWKAISLNDWKEASKQMLTSSKGKSQYLKDVGDRAIRLADRMAALAPATEPQAQEEKQELTPVKAGLFEDESGKLFMVDEQGKRTEV